jgi:MoxR-like ATPase
MNTAALILDYNAYVFNNSSAGAVPVAWPFFIAGTGQGKSARAYQLAQALGRAYYKVNLLSMENTEVMGVPRFFEDAETNFLTMRRALPTWAASALRRPTLLLVDEADKARPDNWSVCLDFLADLTIDDVSLRRHLVVVLAGQPIDREILLSTEEGRALTARLVWLPIDQQETREYVSRRHGRPAIDWLPIRQPNIPLLPEPCERQLDWLAGFFDWLRDRPDLDDDTRERVLDAVLAGMIHPDYRQKAREWVMHEAAPVQADPQTLIDVLAADPERVWRLPLADVYTLLVHGWRYTGWTVPVLRYVVTRLTSELSTEAFSACIREWADSIIATAGGENREVDAFMPLTEADWDRAVVPAFRDAFRRYHEIRNIPIPGAKK